MTSELSVNPSLNKPFPLSTLYKLLLLLTGKKTRLTKLFGIKNMNAQDVVSQMFGVCAYTK
jgi:hypothetical protein